MMQLSRKVEFKDVVTALASISVSIDHIEQRGTILPTELLQMITVNQRLLEFRVLLDVQKSKQIALLADELFELATEFINRARALLLLENVLGLDLDQLLIAYGNAVNAGLRVTIAVSPSRAKDFRNALQWTR